MLYQDRQYDIILSNGEQLEFEINCISGTNDCFTVENNTITFSNITSDSVYSISGKLTGNIIIDVSEEYKFDLELNGFTLQSNTTNPIIVLNGNEVSIKAQKDYINYIYDYRDAIDETDETLYSGAIHSLVDLEIGGKGQLNIVSKNNNGIHSKDDLQVKNLNLFVSCVDNALKGNDSVEIEEATLKLISTQGDGIKTTNSDISSKGNQRGTISILDSKIDIFAACDGIDAAYNVQIDGENTSINIYTDKYSNYSEEVTNNSTDTYYIRYSNSSYKYLQNIYSNHDEKNQAVSLALALTEMIIKGHGVCRVHGGGFAGTIQAFVEDDYVQTYKTEIEKCFGEGSCHVLKVRKYGGKKVL